VPDRASSTTYRCWIPAGHPVLLSARRGILRTRLRDRAPLDSSGRLRARRVGRRHPISDQDLRAVEDELFPMAELPDEWKLSNDGSPAPNWVAALHRSRRDH
jgi:hypothetical protein